MTKGLIRGRKNGAAIIALLMLAGCGAGDNDGLVAAMSPLTGYEEAPKSSIWALDPLLGYSHEDLGGDRVKVRGKVAVASPREDALIMAKVRAAELTKERGFPYFVIVGHRSGSECRGSVPQGGAGKADVGFPIEEITVQMVKEKAGFPEEAYLEPEKIVAELKPRIENPEYQSWEQRGNVMRNRMACDGVILRDD